MKFTWFEAPGTADRGRPNWVRRHALLTALGATVIALTLVLHVVAWGRVLLSRESSSHSLPPSGAGYETHSILLAALGRQYVRPEVEATLLAAFGARAQAEPGRRFVVAETGWRNGGPFSPHVTHREGLSVDILTPLRDEDGRPANLASWPWTLWGYCWHLDENGAVWGLEWAENDRAMKLPLITRPVRPCPELKVGTGKRVDFESAASLLRELDGAARERGGRVEKIIVAPDFLDPILDTDAGREFGALAREFVPKDRKVWVRHDDHIHVDFSFP